MEIFQLFSIILACSVLGAYVNYRFLKLPPTIGLVVIALIISLIILLIGRVELPFAMEVIQRVKAINFSHLLMDVMLSFLLFAGALHINIHQLREEKWPILIFASLGVLLSTFIIGYAFNGLLALFGYSLPLIYCLLFGALISPTDPIAVLAILKKSTVPKRLEVKIAGESLFNDGIAVVVFITLLTIAEQPGEDLN